MAEVLRSRLGLAAAATAASLVLHAAVLSVAVRGTGSPPEPPAVPRMVLSLAGAAIPRLAAVEPPRASVPADEALAAPPPPAPAPTESPPVAADALAAVPPSPPAPAVAAEASPATDPGIPAIPPTVGDIPDAAAPRETPPAPDPPASQSIAEAAPPPTLASPPDRPTVAEAPAAGQAVAMAAGGEPPARPAQAPADVQPAVAPAPPDPLIAASDAPAITAPLTASPWQLAEVAPPAPLSPLPDTAVAAVPPRSSGADAIPVESAPTATPPTTAEAVPGTAIAALEPPPVSAERVRTFVDRYDGGPCFFASVAGAAATGTHVETFSATIDQVMAFHSAFLGQLGVEPHVFGQRVWKAQCPVIELLRTEHMQSAGSSRIEIDHREMHGGEMLTGTVKDVGQADVTLFLVSESGAITDLSGGLARTGNDRPFAWQTPPRKGSGAYPQLLVAAISASSRSDTPLALVAAAQDWLRSSKRTPLQARRDIHMQAAFFLIDY